MFIRRAFACAKGISQQLCDHSGSAPQNGPSTSMLNVGAHPTAAHIHAAVWCSAMLGRDARAPWLGQLGARDHWLQQEWFDCSYSARKECDDAKAHGSEPYTGVTFPTQSVFVLVVLVACCGHVFPKMTPVLSGHREEEPREEGQKDADEKNRASVRKPMLNRLDRDHCVCLLCRCECGKG
jgi:hypothetical protein